MSEYPYQPSPVDIQTLDNHIYMVDYATATGNLISPPPVSSWILRTPTATDSKTIYVDTIFTTFTIDTTALSQANIGMTLLIKNTTNMYAPVPTTAAQKVYVPGPAATADVPYPPNVPGSYFSGVWIETYPERAVGDAPAHPIAPATYDPGTPWTANPAVTTGGCSPYNYYTGHPYKDDTVIDITESKFGIYQLVNYQTDYPETGLNRFTFVRTKESLGLLPGALIYVRSGIQNGGQIFLMNATNPNFCLGTPASPNVTLTGTYTISNATTTVSGSGGADPVGDGLVANDIVLLYGMQFKVLSVSGTAPIGFVVDKIPQYSKSGITVTKIGFAITFDQAQPAIPDPLSLTGITVTDTTILATSLSSTVSMGQPLLGGPTLTPSVITIQPWNTLDISNVTLIGGTMVIPNPITVNVANNGYVLTKFHTSGTTGAFFENCEFTSFPLYLQNGSSLSGTWKEDGGYGGDIIIRTLPAALPTTAGDIRIEPGVGWNFITNSILSNPAINLTLTAGAGAIVSVGSATTFNQNVTIDPTKQLRTSNIFSNGANLVISASTALIDFSTCTLMNVGPVITALCVTPQIVSLTGTLNVTNTNLINVRDVTMTSGRTLTVDNITSHNATPLILASPGLGGYIGCSNVSIRNFDYLQQTSISTNTFAGTIALGINGLPGITCGTRSIENFDFLQQSGTTTNTFPGTIALGINGLPGITCGNRTISLVSGMTFSSAIYNTALAGYLEGTQNVDYHGPWGLFTSITGRIRYTVVGKQVTVNFRGISGITTSPNYIVTFSIGLPSSIFPTEDVNFVCPVLNAGIQIVGSGIISSAGNVYLFPGNVASTPGPLKTDLTTIFTTGVCGFPNFSISYNLGAY